MNSRRIADDRRKQATPCLSRYAISGGRRRTVRRKSDKKKHIFVDHYDSRLLTTLLLLLVLSVLDAYFTLSLLKENVVAEANPIMALYLAHGDMTFFLEKFLFTSAAIFIFCILNHFRVMKISLVSAIIIYLGVVFYEASIMYNFFPRF